MTTIADLRPDAHNRRRHTPRNVGMIVNALHEVGAARSIVIDEQGTILAGNATVEAAAEAGIERVHVVDADGETIVAVRRTGLTEEQKRRLALYDNRAAELAEWDTEQIAADLEAGLNFDGLFTGEEIREITSRATREVPEDPGAQIDKAEELQEKWQTERGQVWEIPSATGKCHRLMCGDSTSAEDVALLLCGERPLLMVTDPPYGVAYEGGVVNEAKRERIAGDESAALYGPALRLAASAIPEGAWYVWHAGREALGVYEAVGAAGYDIRALLIWNKIDAHYGAPSAHYCQKHEPCLYCVRGNAHWAGPSNEVTVWDIKQPSVNEWHPTQKPVECMARPIRNHEGDVYDPFLGSGTTMVAAEQLGRVCYGMEIEPKYVAVALERLAGIGLAPRLIDGD